MFRLPTMNEYSVVSIHDPAVDLKKSDLEKYQETLNMKNLKFKKGQEPTVFVIKALTPQELNTVDGKGLELSRFADDDAVVDQAALDALFEHRLTTAQTGLLRIEGWDSCDLNVPGMGKVIGELAGYVKMVSESPLAFGDQSAKS